MQLKPVIQYRGGAAFDSSAVILISLLSQQTDKMDVALC
jgi:hypothetical protein